MDFKILDASAFYAGIPFGSPVDFVTTSLVYDEIKHIKKNHDAIGVLFETGRLKIREPDSESTNFVKNKAQETGDLQQLSKEDISVLALCYELKGELISDDYAVRYSDFSNYDQRNWRCWKVDSLLCWLWKEFPKRF